MIIKILSKTNKLQLTFDSGPEDARPRPRRKKTSTPVLKSKLLFYIKLLKISVERKLLALQNYSLGKTLL